VFGSGILTNDGVGKDRNRIGVDLRPVWWSPLVVVLCSDIDIHLPHLLTTAVLHLHPSWERPRFHWCSSGARLPSKHDGETTLGQHVRGKQCRKEIEPSCPQCRSRCTKT
jgi:hypothetical protein